MSVHNSPIPVSVIIPCWRSRETVGRAVASVAAQRLAPAEVILVDDASGDGTADVLEALAAQYPQGWIRVIRLPDNRGPGGARNAGWGASLQPWLAFLDADDAWHPQKLEIQWRVHQEQPDLVLSGHGTAVASVAEEQAAVSDGPATRRVSFIAMLVANRFPTRSVMMRRDLPFRFEGRDVAEDYLLWLRVVLAGLPSARIEAALAFSFRSDASPGGWSGQLWTHERRELKSWHRLRELGELSVAVWALASLWSLAKYLRREATMRFGVT